MLLVNLGLFANVENKYLHEFITKNKLIRYFYFIIFLDGFKSKVINCFLSTFAVD